VTEYQALGVPWSFALRVRESLVGVYLLARLAATVWILSVLLGVLTLDGDGWAAAALAATVVTAGLFATLAHAERRALRIGDPGRQPMIWICITDQLFFTGLACAIGTGHSTTPLLATAAPPLAATLLAGLEVGLPLATFNACAIAVAVLTDVSVTAMRPDWPLFVAYGFLFCVPAWMFNRLLNAIKRLEDRVQRNVQGHSDVMAAALRAENEAGRIHDLLHRAENGLWNLVPVLRSRREGRVVDVDEHIATSELAAAAWRLALRIRKDIAPLRESPPLR
jgi:hypothetical protein